MPTKNILRKTKQKHDHLQTLYHTAMHFNILKRKLHNYVRPTGDISPIDRIKIFRMLSGYRSLHSLFFQLIKLCPFVSQSFLIRKKQWTFLTLVTKTNKLNLSKLGSKHCCVSRIQLSSNGGSLTSQRKDNVSVEPISQTQTRPIFFTAKLKTFP